MVKRDGSTELFHPEKLLRGLTRACTKRNVPVERLQEIVADIERELREESAYQVSSERVGKMALERLQEVDLVAYVRFASVYRQFESVEEFKRRTGTACERGDQMTVAELRALSAELEKRLSPSADEGPREALPQADRGRDALWRRRPTCSPGWRRTSPRPIASTTPRRRSTPPSPSSSPSWPAWSSCPTPPPS